MPSPNRVDDDWVRRWADPSHELEADDLEMITDMINETAKTLDLPSVCAPWFSFRDQFEGASSKVPAIDIRKDIRVLDRYLGMKYAEKKVCLRIPDSHTPSLNGIIQELLTSLNVRYCLDACYRNTGKLKSIIFLTHLDSMSTVSNEAEGFTTGHWVAVQHKIDKKKVVIWDSLPGDGGVLVRDEVEEQIKNQCVVAAMLRGDSETLVSTSYRERLF